MLGAVEMCNNNGTCRAFDASVMCPSWRVTRDERHLTRGRANTLRLALTGQLGADAMASGALAEHHGAVRVVQGVPARMSDRRRHGEDEDRSAGGARRAARRQRTELADRRTAALCADRRPHRAASQPAQRGPDAAPDGRALAGPRRIAPAARLAARLFSRHRGRRIWRPPIRAARSCCWRTPSIATSSRKTCAPRCACWLPPAIAPGCRSRGAARCAAGAAFSRPA